MDKKICNAKVLVIGDIMLDKYYNGSSNRISPEAPVPVVNVKEIEDRVGGAGNVALNISSLGGKVGICGLVGNDFSANELETKLDKFNVNNYFVKTNLPTITKLRVLAQRQQLVRIDFEENFKDIDKTSLIKKFEKEVSKYNVVVFSDYAKGTLSNIQPLIQIAKKQNCMVLVDPKGSDFNKYSGATIITPNMKEFQEVAGKCETEKEIVENALKIMKKTNIENILVTRSEKGMTLIRNNGECDTIPTVAKEVFDVTGAGDTVIGVLAMCLSVGNTKKEAIKIANAAAGVVVGKVGTATVSLDELHESLKPQIRAVRGITDELTLKSIVKDTQSLGEKIVMTNGCFDILHAGHVEYLQASRNLGDRLIVAVNTDESVSKLKGSLRPVVTLDSRMQLLSALECVDWVVPFSEQTPQKIIENLTPDILVKGADYTIENIVGAEHVIKNGGKVETITLKPNHSTSNIVNKILASKTN